MMIIFDIAKISHPSNLLSESSCLHLLQGWTLSAGQFAQSKTIHRVLLAIAIDTGNSNCDRYQ
jgi:hypothetical protein